MIKVLNAGLYTSIQDLGRRGYRNYGIPVAGAMDSHSAKLSNLILGNDAAAAVMEITLQGPKLEFASSTEITITGADLSPSINEQSIDHNRTMAVKKGDVLSFGKRKNGARCYLGVNGGFETIKMFGSRSFYPEITDQSTIKNGDELFFKIGMKPLGQSSVQLKKNEDWIEKQEIVVCRGPEFEKLSESQKQELSTKEYTLGMNNRMAYQIKERMKNELNPILSSAVLPGTVQLTPSGKMILLMRDCQTTGGYPRILQLTEESINSLSQKMQFETIRFKLI